MQNDDNKDAYRLIACNHDGSLTAPLPSIPKPIAEACLATSRLYDRLGYSVPWTGYVAAVGEVAVGGGAFVGPPVSNRVEIAYFTLSDCEGQGYAGMTARTLIAIARATSPTVEIFAKTLPEPNASTRILERLGFDLVGTAQDEEIGTAWAWLLGSPSLPLSVS